MSFSHWYVLPLLIVPIALLLAVWRRRTGRVTMPFDHSGVRPSRFWAFTINAMECLPPLLLAVAILLLAGPKRLGEPKSKRIVTNIEICLDISGSMTATFGGGTRYDGAMKSLEDFVNYRKGDAFGLTFFGDNVLHWCPITKDVSAITCSTPFMRPENVPHWFGGTMIAKAVRACQQLLRDREEGDRMVVLITDGVSYDLQNGADVELAASLNKDRISVFAILIGEIEPPGEVVNLARLTGGEVFDAADPTILNVVFQKIDAMKPTRLEKTTAESRDFFEPICYAGMGLGLAWVLATLGWRYTPW